MLEFIRHNDAPIVTAARITQYSDNMVKKNQNEVMVEICSKSLVRAIGKILRIEFS